MLISPETFKPENPRGFVVLEGGNGAGKSSLQKGLNAWLDELKIPTLLSFEPGGTPLGQTIREVLLGDKFRDREPKAELFLFCADRVEHTNKVIRPALEGGQLVLLDRYFYSTIAFQGYGRSLGYDFTEQVCLQAVADLIPDLVILLDIDAEEALKRKQAQEEEDAFEEEELQFHTALQKGFVEISQKREEPFLVLDASKPEEEVLEEAKAGLLPLLHALGHGEASA